MDKWEYKMIRDDDETIMNRLGQQGWEAVGMATFSGSGTIKILFKRKVR
jgi:hypothetical protein